MIITPSNPRAELATPRLVDAWVADQVGTLAATDCAALDRAAPDWRSRAAQLIAEGLLAYVAVEMVAPDLAIARHDHGAAQGSDGAELTARLGAHLRDFVDYRDELAALGGRAGAPSRHQHESRSSPIPPQTGPRTGPAP